MWGIFYVTGDSMIVVVNGKSVCAHGAINHFRVWLNAMIVNWVSLIAVVSW